MSNRDYPTEKAQEVAAGFVRALARAVHTRDRCHVAYEQLPLKVGSASRFLVAHLLDVGILNADEAAVAYFEADSVREHGVIYLFCGGTVLELDLCTAEISEFVFKGV